MTRLVYVQFEEAYSLADPGGATGAHPPPTGSNSFIFTYVFTEKHPCQRLAPPNVSAPPQWEILDPQLILIWSSHEESPKSSSRVRLGSSSLHLCSLVVSPMTGSTGCIGAGSTGCIGVGLLSKLTGSSYNAVKEVGEELLSTSSDGLFSWTVITDASVEYDAVDKLSSDTVISYTIEGCRKVKS